MEVKLVVREPVTVACFRHLGPYGEPIARFWQNVYVPWAIRNRLGREHARFGISYDNPVVTAPEQCRYDACAEVAPDFVPSGGARKATIAGGQYAVFDFTGTAGDIEAMWAKLHLEWLPSSGMALDDRPCFEFYPRHTRHDDRADRIECQLCLPVRAMRRQR